MKNDFDRDLLSKREKLVDDAIKTLKTEFIGIDDQIDSVMDNLRTWFLFPELQTRPLVVSLWGMSGVGKTSLVKRIAELLEIDKDMVYFNFAEIGECSSWEIENELEEKLSNEKSNRMFVYDEFQYAATLDKHGDEITKKSGLKPFWELLDTGIIRKRDDFWTVRDLQNVLKYMLKINRACPIDLRNGVWVNAADCLKHFEQYDIIQFGNFFYWEIDEKEAAGKDVMVTQSTQLNKFFLRESIVEKILSQYDKTVGKIEDRLDVYHKLERMSFDEIFQMIERVFNNARRGYDINFSDSIVLVLGNLDEAYEMALNVDPDMSPDQFHKITKKLNIVDIKKGLQERFRSEQIARLGNIHVIYPSFSSDSFKKIIELNLNTYAKDVNEQLGIKVEFKKSIIELIYKESVFPTHGTRPVFSSIHEIVRSKLPNIVRSIYENNKDVVKVVFSFRAKHTIVECYNAEEELVLTNKYKEKLRLENDRNVTKDNNQSAVATHESGHFVIYSKLFGKLPEKLCSKTATKDKGGFLMHDDDEFVQSYEYLINKIKVSLGGYVAEEVVFGNECRTVGASEDLRNATEIASRIVRDFGMGNEICVSTYYTEATNCRCGHILKNFDDTAVNEEIRAIVLDCYLDVKDTFEKQPEWREMLKKSSLYLCEHSTMPKRKMKEIYESVPKSVRELPDKTSYYRTKIEAL